LTVSQLSRNEYLSLVALDDWTALLAFLPSLLVKYGPSILSHVYDYFSSNQSKGIKQTALDYI